MELHPLQLGLAQLAAIIISAVTLIAQPQLAILVAMFAGLVMAFSMASSLAIGHYYSQQVEDGEEEVEQQLSSSHAAQLGTHFGGLVCNIVMICEAFRYIH
jgi:hypothetical protein